MRTVVAACKTIYERLAYDQLSLISLLDVRGRQVHPAGPERTVRSIPIPGTHRDYGIAAPPDTRLSFRLRLGARPRFETRVGFLQQSETPAPAVEFVVILEEHGAERTLFKERITAASKQWRGTSIDLRPWAGQEVTLVLETRLLVSHNEPVQAVWNTPRLVEERPIPDRWACLVDDVRKLGRKGLKEAFLAIMKGQLVIEDQRSLYQLWVEKHGLSEADIREISQSIRSFSYQPTISIITPIFNTNPLWLRRCIESVRAQLYPNWELCLADDASTDGQVVNTLREYAALDPRIKVEFLERNQGIARASNRALAMATGDFVGLLDHDDELASDALYEVVRILQDSREADIVYSDEDKLDPDGRRSEPFFKPDWSPEYLLSCMYTCHFSVYRRQLVHDVGGFRAGYDGSQDYDLMLRAAEQTENVVHIPRILYHWRKATGSAAGSTGAKPYAYVAAKKALADYLKRRNMAAEVLDGQWYGHYRVRHDVDPTTRVLIVVSARDSSGSLRRCIESIRTRTQHSSHQIVITEHESATDDLRSYLVDCSERVLRGKLGTGSSELRNRAAQESDSPYLLFVDGSTEVINNTWLEAMLEFSQQPKIGVVGAKLLSTDGSIRHAGMILGLGADGLAGETLPGFPSNTGYHFGLASDVRNCSAVSGSCMLVRRDVFDIVGGFDKEVPPRYSDLDLCLRIRQEGYRIVWTPYAQLYQHGSSPTGSQPEAADIEFMRVRWGTTLGTDPYYNPNLTRDRADFGIRL